MARADRDAILVTLIQELGELPPHFDLGRFAVEVERWQRQGKSTKEIARLVLAQCEACAPKQPRRPRDGFFTVQAHHQSGGLFRTVEHVLAAEIAQVKRRLERESSSRLVFTLLSEGTKPRTVQGSFDFQPTPDEIAHAQRVVQTARDAQARSVGAWVVDGKMIDAPFVQRAQSVVALAARLGLLSPDRP